MGRQLLYECPICKTHNKPEETNCTKCGHWLNSTAYPPKVIHKKSVARSIFKGLGIAAASLIGLLILFGVLANMSNQNQTNPQLTAANAALAKQQPTIGDRKNPFPIGSQASLGIEQFAALTGANRHKFSITIQVNEVIRGEVANGLVKSWNQLNAAPKDGYGYLIANVTVNVLDSVDDVPFEMNQNVLSLVSGGGIKYENVYVVAEESINATMYEGASHSGRAVFQVKIDDPNPLLESVSVWFRTN